jgi:hypothetical protein
VEKGGTLETYDDIPDSLREQLYIQIAFMVSLALNAVVVEPV